MAKKGIALLLSLLILLSAAVPVLAEEAESGHTLAISSTERLLAFAENCRLDSYSQGLTVHLTRDLDVSGLDFQGIPIFCGTFQGNNHTISGLELSADGSVQGLFRYLTADAAVYDLNLRGSVNPGGSQEMVGGLAGSNAGLIKNCSFEGDLSGSDRVGGLVGVNTVSGIIEGSRVRGDIHGSHFIGGIAGENLGVIRDCVNHALVNTTSQQNTVSLSDVTLEGMLHSESAATVTDIGGIAGNSTGVIRDCVNRGNIGYRHMGYNIGGIAGTQSGYVISCENRGSIEGRKEVGGIVGQMEPAIRVEYDEDALQILKRQLSGLSSTVSRTAANVQNTGEALSGQVGYLQAQIWNAGDALSQLMPDPGNPELPDMDAIHAAQNGLSSSLAGMNEALYGMSSTAQSTIGTLSNNIHAIQSQINAMSATLSNVSETLGGSLKDVSDEDTDEDISGKVAASTNLGSVLGDLNVGGITGAMALENDLDPEEDLEFLGNRSLNFESEVRAVVLDCENRGSVTARKRAAGGIVGWQSLGLVRSCRNAGSLEGESAEYVGGIAGQSTGYIRTSNANCVLNGSSKVGGIAGTAAIVTDCRSLVRFDGGDEQLGAILGNTEDPNEEEEDPITGNYYLALDDDPGGIDGVSYDGLAQSLPAHKFFKLEELPEVFSKAIVTFLLEDGTNVKTLEIPTGRALPAGEIPALPDKAGSQGKWDGLSEANLKNIYFDLTFTASYRTLRTVISSSEDEAKPKLLLQGTFSEDTTLTVTPTSGDGAASAKDTLLEAWALELSHSDPVTTGRLLLPEGVSGGMIRLRKDGQWQEAEAEADGSYLVFPMDTDVEAVALLEKTQPAWYLPAAIGGAVLLAGSVLLVLLRKRKKKQ